MNYGDSILSRLKLHRIAPKLSDIAQKPFAGVFASRSSMRLESFQAWGQELPYFVHRHNTTWKNERCVELPVVLEFLKYQGHGRGMEFGNVLMRYGITGDWEIVDKYDRIAGVKNVDILDYNPSAPLDYIVSISTIEHVGWDEKPRDSEKVLRAFEHLRSLLGANGRMLLSAPMGHHPTLDEVILSKAWPVVRTLTLVRDRGRWRETPVPEWRPYVGKGRRGASSVWFAEVAPQTS